MVKWCVRLENGEEWFGTELRYDRFMVSMVRLPEAERTVSGASHAWPERTPTLFFPLVNVTHFGRVRKE